MSDILFPTDTTSVTPATWDIIMLADVSDSNNLKETTLAELPISTATQTALDTKQATLTGLTASVTELNYTDGVTSAIQTQLDGKQATITGLTASGAELNILDGATLTTTELNYVDGVTSAIQTQIDGKQATLVSGTNIKTVNSTSLLGSGDIVISGAVSDGDKGDITVSASGATWTIDNNVVSNAKLAQVATATFKGRTTAGTGNSEDLTATQATALLNVAVGDSGSGGTKWLVPAPASGDATKFLRGDMTYVTISGGGDALTANPLSQFASTTSAQLAGVMSDETGSGSLVFATSPTLVTPSLGVATATSINGATITSGTLNGSVTGTNTGDQTSIVWITGTKAQFDTAVTDGNIVYTDAIWVSVQAYDADLTTWAGITPWANVGTALAVAVGSAGAIVTNGWALGTPSSGTLTNATGLPLSWVVDSTTEALGVGSLEVWHASDTTITRVSAWVIAVEGVTVPTETSTNTLTNKTLTTPTITKPVMSATNPTAQTYTPSASGTATLDLSLSNQHDITMPAGNITIALSNVTNNQIFLVSITQDGTGSRTVTWFSTIRWAGGSTPTLTTTANKRDMFGFKRTGANTYDGFIIWQNI